jgi:hypothetical protein
LKDGEVLRRAAREFDVFLTVDQALQYQQLAPNSFAVITVIARTNKIEYLSPLIPEVLRLTIHPGERVRVGARQQSR